MSQSIKLTASGNIDILYYQRQAEIARAEAIQALLRSAKSKLLALIKPRKIALPQSHSLTPAH